MPGLVVFDTCTRLIRDISAVQHDEKNPSDVAKEPHEYTHSPDAIRYLCVFRAMGAMHEPEQPDEDEGLAYDDYMTGQEATDSYLDFGG